MQFPTITYLSFFLQYSNESNPLAHYLGTAHELDRQCNGKIDMLVCIFSYDKISLILTFALKRLLEQEQEEQ